MGASKLLRGITIGAFVLSYATSAMGGAHTWDVNEVFSNADGTVQFIELFEANGTPGETGLPGQTVSSNANNFVIPGPALTPPTTNMTYLLATAAFAALPGAPTPDAIIPDNFFSTGGDTITYGVWDSFTFGAGALPTDGINSLNRDLSTGVNSPKNYAGQSGSVDASPPSGLPTLTQWGTIAIAALLLLVGAALALERGRARAS